MVHALGGNINRRMLFMWVVIKGLRTHRMFWYSLSTPGPQPNASLGTPEQPYACEGI